MERVKKYFGKKSKTSSTFYCSLYPEENPISLSQTSTFNDSASQEEEISHNDASSSYEIIQEVPYDSKALFNSRAISQDDSLEKSEVSNKKLLVRQCISKVFKR